jgi:predicted amidohydrolase
VRAGLIQLCSGDEPQENLRATEAMVREAAAGGATLILTPECTNLMTGSRTRREAALAREEADPTLARLRAVAAELGVWLVIGSLGLKTGEARLANRSFAIAPDGGIAARYDKIHMFDVELGDGESYRESAAFLPGDRAVTVQAGAVRLGLTICYDLRFPHLHRVLAQAGAEVLAVPSAFTAPTGQAHWHVLLRARAIETGCFVLAPAQSGEHPVREGPGRRTFGHSLAVGPWGEVLADAGEEVGVTLVDLELAEVARARERVPSLEHDRAYLRP